MYFIKKIFYIYYFFSVAFRGRNWSGVGKQLSILNFYFLFASFLIFRFVELLLVFPPSRYVDEVEVMTFTRGVEEIFGGKVGAIEINTCKKY